MTKNPNRKIGIFVLVVFLFAIPYLFGNLNKIELRDAETSSV